MAVPRSRTHNKPARSATVGPLTLLEEAFQLVRTTPLSILIRYYIGTAPFAAALFFFWADMSRSSFALQDAPQLSLTLGVLYLWMKAWHSGYCAGLWEQLDPGAGEISHLTTGRKARNLAAQSLIFAFSIPIMLVSAVLLVPIGWTYAGFHNVNALALTQNFGNGALRGLIGRSLQLSHYDWARHKGMMVVWWLFCLVAFMSGFVAVVSIAALTKAFFGEESVVTQNPIVLLNTTFLFGVALIVWLFVGPMTKAIYTLRCFYALSRTTGADLMSRLATVKRATTTVTALLVLLGCSLPLNAQSQEALSETEALHQAIESTLAERDFQWRLPRDLREAGANSDAEEESGFFRSMIDKGRDLLKEGGRLFKDFLDRIFRGSDFENEGRVNRPSFNVSEITSWVLIAVVVGLVIWLIFMVVRNGPRPATIEGFSDEMSPIIDLENESIVANQLPENEWTRLATEQLDAGNHVLAVRALFLATLAHLGERGLIKIDRAKSNSDYSRELSRKGRGEAESMFDAFGENLGQFERVWYGLHGIGRDAVEHFQKNYESIVSTRKEAPKDE